jgi:transcriptional regulator with XRE-family HTH domain
MKNNTDNWKRFGRWVAQKREEKGLVQADLGNRIGRDRQTVYRIEAGEPTKRPTVIRIAEALGEPVAVALGIAFLTR